MEESADTRAAVYGVGQLMASSDSQISQDEIFDLLSNPRRRYVINYLLREDRPVSIQELSRELGRQGHQSGNRAVEVRGIQRCRRVLVNRCRLAKQEERMTCLDDVLVLLGSELNKAGETIKAQSPRL